MHTKIKILFSCSLFTIICWFTFAHDCGLVATTQDITSTTGYNTYKTFIQNINNQNYEGILPKEALAKAFQNLKKDCCQEKILDKSFCIGYTDSINYPQSAFLYDQLVDVWLRRLDGDTSLAYGVDVDPLGKERREFITDAANAKDGEIAKKIMTTYQTYRTGRNTQLKKEGVIQNYNTATAVSLTDKYYYLCEFMRDIYDKIGETDTAIGQYKNSFFSKCQKLTSQRVNNEYLYTQTLMVKKSNELLHETTKAFTMNYFIQEKMMTLINTINRIKSLFTTMVTQAAASKTCSK